MRKRWAAKVNEYLARANVPRNEWVDHRTLAVQREEALGNGDYEAAIRLSRLPKRHRGKAATAIVARGGISTRMEDLRRDAEAGAGRVASMLWEVEEHRRVRLAAIDSKEGGRELFEEKLEELDPGWRERGTAVAAARDAALTYAETELARIGEERRAEEERRLAAEEEQRSVRLAAIDSKEGGRGPYEEKLEELDPGWRERGTAVAAARDAALTYAETELERIEAARRAEEERRLAAEEEERRVRLAAIDSKEGGRALYEEKLEELDPGWRERGTAVAAARDAALTYAETELERIGEERRAEEERRATERTERRERAEAAAREAGIDDVQGVYAGARLRGEDEVTALDTATATTRKAELALLTDEQMEGIRLAAERDRKGSGWPALGTAVAERCERKLEAEDAARRTGVIDVEAEFASARERGEDPVAGLVRVARIVVEAREALLTDDAIRAIHAGGESRARGGGWTAVERAAAERKNRKARAESAAREVGVDDFDAVYAAARAGAKDPLAALEEATAAVRRAERREARRRELQVGSEGARLVRRIWRRWFRTGRRRRSSRARRR